MTDILVSLVTLGCNKNQTDSEFLIAGLAQYFDITADLKQADVIILSPCSFLKSARIEAQKYINDLAKYKKNKCSCLAVTGCYAEHLANKILDENLEVDLVIGLTNILDFANQIKKFLITKKRVFAKGDNTVFGVFGEDADRVRLSPYSAYVKIADGCDNYCSYCLIPKIRGNYRSRSKRSILKEIKTLLESGVKELNIVAQDVGRYDGFIDLINEISALEYDFFIRLLYLHPKHIDKELVNLLKFNDKVLNYLDIPIQHINDEILKSMNRKITKAEIIDKLNLLRAEIKDIALRTTFIIGYPIEDRVKFEELKDFVYEQKFDRVGVFAYSNEKGTESFKLGDQITESIKQKRIVEIMEIQSAISLDKNKKLIGKEFCILMDDFTRGRIYSMAPEVDGYINVNLSDDFIFPEDFDGILDVKITKAYEYDLEALLI